MWWRNNDESDQGRQQEKSGPEPCAEVCVFHNPGNICLSNKQNCKASISVGLSAYKMYPYNVLSTLEKELAFFEKTSCRRSDSRLPESSARRHCESWPIRKVITVGAVLRHVCIKDAPVCVVFGMARNLAVPVLLCILHRRNLEMKFPAGA